MMIDKYLPDAVRRAAGRMSRRNFVIMSVGGAVGLAAIPLGLQVVGAQQAAKLPPGQKPTEQPPAFVTIAPDGTTTILCNRMDMGQGIETALAMICAEELGADWSKVKTGFGDQRGNYVDPMLGMHLTGGSTRSRTATRSTANSARARGRC